MSEQFNDGLYQTVKDSSWVLSLAAGDQGLAVPGPGQPHDAVRVVQGGAHAAVGHRQAQRQCARPCNGVDMGPGAFTPLRSC